MGQIAWSDRAIQDPFQSTVSTAVVGSIFMPQMGSVTSFPVLSWVILASPFQPADGEAVETLTDLSDAEGCLPGDGAGEGVRGQSRSRRRAYRGFGLDRPPGLGPDRRRKAPVRFVSSGHRGLVPRAYRSRAP